MTNEQRAQLTPDALDACRNELDEMRDGIAEPECPAEYYDIYDQRRADARAALDVAVLACAELAERRRKEFGE